MKQERKATARDLLKSLRLLDDRELDMEIVVEMPHGGYDRIFGDVEVNYNKMVVIK
jgi:hypothetical protein